MVDEAIALRDRIDSYSKKRKTQETIEGIACNKELHEKLQQITNEQSNVNRTPQQIENETKN